MKTFPITQAQFLEWLAAKPDQRCDRSLSGRECPLVNAVFDLTGVRLRDSFVFATHPKRFPAWVLKAVDVIDSGIDGDWQRTRGYVLRLLRKSTLCSQSH